MGNQRRLIAGGVCALVALGAGGCGRDEPSADARRREILRPAAADQIRAERRARAELTDAHGELVPSDLVVAGVTLPRGFTLVLGLEHAWYYRSASASLEQLDRYFLARLESREIRRSAREIEFVWARPKGVSGAVPVTLRIRIAPDDPRQREIYVEAPRPGPTTRPSEAEVRAQLEARRTFAE